MWAGLHLGMSWAFNGVPDGLDVLTLRAGLGQRLHCAATLPDLCRYPARLLIWQPPGHTPARVPARSLILFRRRSLCGGAAAPAVGDNK